MSSASRVAERSLSGLAAARACFGARPRGHRPSARRDRTPESTCDRKDRAPARRPAEAVMDAPASPLISRSFRSTAPRIARRCIALGLEERCYVKNQGMRFARRSSWRGLEQKRFYNGSRRGQAMPVDLSVKQVDDEIAERLREQAKRNHRSLQGELKAILEEAVSRRQRLTIHEVAARVRELGISTPSEAVEIVRQGREDRTRHIDRVLEESRARHAGRR